VSSAAFSSRVWNGLTGVSRPGENLIPQVLDDLEVDHDVHRAVLERQLGQISLAHVDARVARPDVRHGGVVVIQTDDVAGHAGDQVGAVALAGPGLEHDAVDAPVQQPLVHHFVPTEPVILLGQPGDGALPGQGKRVHVRERGIGWFGLGKCAHCQRRLTQLWPLSRVRKVHKPVGGAEG